MKRLGIVITLIAIVIAVSVVIAADVVPNEVQMPGTQPGEAGNLERPDKCDNCHGGYDPAVEPAFNWRGSMMANAGRDPIFWATLAIAEQDFDGVGDSLASLLEELLGLVQVVMGLSALATLPVLLALVPGLPALPFLVIGALMVVAAQAAVAQPGGDPAGGERWPGRRQAGSGIGSGPGTAGAAQKGTGDTRHRQFERCIARGVGRTCKGDSAGRRQRPRTEYLLCRCRHQRDR